MIRPLQGQALLRILPPETHTASGIELPQYRLTPEERQQMSKRPEMPPPEVAIVEAIGPWPALANGMRLLPPFPAGAKVLVREGSGIKCNRNIGERLKLVRTEDILAVLSEG